MLLRDRLTPLKTFVILVLSVALVPPPGAHYAIITVGKHPLTMTADTALLCAAVVLAMPLIALFGAAFSLGRKRDLETGLMRLFATQPAPIRPILLGRLLANTAAGLAFAVFATSVLSATLGWRYGAPPGASSMLVSLLTVFAAAVLAAVIGSLSDLLLPASASLRLTVLFAIWVVAITSSISGLVDVAGMDLLRHMLPGNVPRDQLSLGLISSPSAPTLPWPTLRGGVLVASAGRFGLAGLLLAGACLIILARGNVYGSSRMQITRRHSDGSEAAASTRQQHLPVRRADPGSSPLVRHRQARMMSGLAILLPRLFKRSKLAIISLAIAALIGAIAREPGPAAIILLVVPVFLFAPTTLSELKVARTLEMVEPALQYPRPLLLTAMGVAATTLIAAVPVFSHMAPTQALTLAFGLSSMTLWLAWTHRVLGMPTLGIGIGGGLIYVIGFNDVPPAMDVLGIWHQSSAALAAAALILAALAGSTILFDGRRMRAGA